MKQNLQNFLDTDVYFNSLTVDYMKLYSYIEKSFMFMLLWLLTYGIYICLTCIH
jgi:hypothetical protein